MKGVEDAKRVEALEEARRVEGVEPASRRLGRLRLVEEFEEARHVEEVEGSFHPPNAEPTTQKPSTSLHSQPKQGQVILHRVFGIELLQYLRQGYGGFPVRFFCINQVEPAGNSLHVNIHWANKLVHPDVFPNAKINTCCVFSYHPAEVHVEAFAGRIIIRGRDVFFCSVGAIIQRKKIVVKCL